MPRRPIAHFPFVRRARRPRADAASPADFFVALPKLDPEWELSALHVLMKPPRKADLVRGRAPEQPWSPELAATLQETARRAADRLGASMTLHFPEAGDFLLLVQGTDESHLRAIALALSHAAPRLTFKLPRVYVRAGHFLRRRRGVELALGPARDIHLPRDLRSRLAAAGLLPSVSPTLTARIGPRAPAAPAPEPPATA